MCIRDSYDTGLSQDKLAEIAEYFAPIREESLKSGLLNPKVLGVNIKTLRYQVPVSYTHLWSALDIFSELTPGALL